MKKILFVLLFSTKLFAANHFAITDSKVVDVDLNNRTVRSIKTGVPCAGSFDENCELSQIAVAINGLDGWTALRHPGHFEGTSDLSAQKINQAGEPPNIHINDILSSGSRTEPIRIHRKVSRKSVSERNENGDVVCASYLVETLTADIPRASGNEAIRFSDTRYGQRKAQSCN